MHAAVYALPCTRAPASAAPHAADSHQIMLKWPSAHATGAIIDVIKSPGIMCEKGVTSAALTSRATDARTQRHGSVNVCRPAAAPLHQQLEGVVDLRQQKAVDDKARAVCAILRDCKIGTVLLGQFSEVKFDVRYVDCWFIASAVYHGAGVQQQVLLLGGTCSGRVRQRRSAVRASAGRGRQLNSVTAQVPCVAASKVTFAHTESRVRRQRQRQPQQMQQQPHDSRSSGSRSRAHAWGQQRPSHRLRRRLVCPGAGLELSPPQTSHRRCGGRAPPPPEA